MSEMFRNYAKKHNLKMVSTSNFDLNNIDDGEIGSDVLDLIKHIGKTEKPDVFGGISQETEDFLLEKGNWCKTNSNDIEPLSDEKYQKVYKKLQHKIEEKYKSIYGYNPPIFLKIFSFVPMVKSIINYNQQKYIVDSWKNMPKEEKDEYISNINIAVYVLIN